MMVQKERKEEIELNEKLRMDKLKRKEERLKLLQSVIWTDGTATQVCIHARTCICM